MTGSLPVAKGVSMAKMIAVPAIINSAGNKPKWIKEFFGQVNSGYDGKGDSVIRILLVLALFFLTGCATTFAPSYVYLPEDGEEMVFEAKAEIGLVTDKIFITVNGEVIASGELAIWKKRDDFQGEYHGKEILAQCFAWDRNPESDTVHECNIFIDNEKLTTLIF